MRRAARTDGTQKAIVAALRDAGAVVYVASAIGQGFPDIIVCVAGRIFLCELKDESKPKADRQLTEAQVKFHKAWPLPIAVLSSVDQANKWCEERKREAL